MTNNGKQKDELERMRKSLDFWKQKSFENEEKKNVIIQSMSVLNELNAKINFFEQENQVLQKTIDELTSETMKLHEDKGVLVNNFKDISSKYNKLVDNHKLCISELEKIQELENQYNNPDLIVPLIDNWSNVGNIQQLVFLLEDYLLSKLNNKEVVTNNNK